MDLFRNSMSVVFAFLPLLAFSQHPTEPHAAAGQHDIRPVRISMVVSHTYLPTATATGKESLILPSVGLDVEYWLNPFLGIGLHNDLELLVFEVEKEENVFIEREYPVLVTLDGMWKPYRGLVFYGGPGFELEPQENYFVFRIGAEYEVEIKDHWDLFPTFYYDFRKGAYDTFTFGLGVGKRF